MFPEKANAIQTGNYLRQFLYQQEVIDKHRQGLLKGGRHKYEVLDANFC